MLERGVEVDVVRHLERQAEAGISLGDARPVVGARGGDCVLPGRAARREQLVQRRPREDVAQAREVDDLVAVPPEEASARLRSSQDPQLLELLERLEERARPDRVEKRAADVGEPGRRRLLVAPAERALVQRECGRLLAQRLLLVAEDRGRKDVEEAMLAGSGRVSVVKAGRRLEDEPARAAAADELRDSSAVGTHSPPQRIFARSPRAATSSSGTLSR